MQEIKNGIDRTHLYNNRMNDIRYYSGVTTYAPAETYRNEWQQTAWYAATKR